MTDYKALRERTTQNAQKAELVTVNTRALIDKVLARYSSENTTLRELIQNAADANANSVEIRYTTEPALEDRNYHFEENEELRYLQKRKVKQLVVRNDGMAFREEDWERVKRIADGNPDETKIGAFGVGFYSVFADSDEPFIISGDQMMAFYWEKDTLYTRRAKMEKPDPFTSFVLDYREPGDLPDLQHLCQFFATSLTFVKLGKISLYVDDRELCVVKKKVMPPNNLSLPPGVIPTTHEKMMTITAIESSMIQIEATYMNVTHYKPSTSVSAGSFFKSLLSLSNNTEKTPKIHLGNLQEYTSAAMFFRIATATLSTNVPRKFAAELERATKKPPPKTTTLAVLTMSKDELDASEKDVEIFENIVPAKAGRIFIGFPTHQTTGIKAHISAHSVIPTVERENIDLNARVIKNWNIEMLRAAGILSRIMYVNEMNELGRRAAGLKPTHLKALHAEAIHIMNQFTHYPSTPSSDVGAHIADSFWNCTKKTVIELLSTKGVLPSNKLRLTSDVDFLEDLPLLPEELKTGAPSFVETLRRAGYLTEITPTDIKFELAEKPLTTAQGTKFLQWLANNMYKGNIDSMQGDMLLGEAVVMALPTDSSKSEEPFRLATIEHFVDPQILTPNLPLPHNCIPFPVTSTIRANELNTISWHALSAFEWIKYVVENRTRLPGQNLEWDEKFAETVLQIVNKNWDKLNLADRTNIINTLSVRKCIPTKSGKSGETQHRLMKIPKEAYFPNVKLFSDLPIVNVEKVKEKVLAELGVRKTVDLALVFERLMGAGHDGTKWSHVDLIKYLVSVESDLKSEEIRKLQNTAIAPAEGSDTRARRFNELYHPDDELRALGLPIVSWPGEWRSNTPLVMFLYRLGLHKSPKEETLIPICASKDAPLRERALKYLIKHFYTNGYNTRYLTTQNVSFLPLQNSAHLRKPNGCFSNPAAAILGFDILRSDLTDYATILGVAPDPPADSCCRRLKDNPPKSPTEAKPVYEYFTSRLRSMSQYHAQELGNTAIVPVAVKPGDRESGTAKFKLVPPRICYLGPSTHKYAAIFDFVDFGSVANSFLHTCGSRPEPSTNDIAYRLAAEPNKLYNVFLSDQRYLDVLRNIAVEWGSLKKDKELLKLMTSAKCLGAYLSLETEDDAESEEKGAREFRLASAKDIVINNDVVGHNVFKSKILVAPEDDTLEHFYARLGAPYLSDCIESTPLLGPATGQSPDALHAKILERTRLFLHTQREEISHDARWLEQNLAVEFRVNIQLRRVLRLPGSSSKLATDTKDATATVISGQPNRAGKRFTLMVTDRYDWYDIATGIAKLLLKKDSMQAALVLETLLRENLETLKTRGFNVERILKQKREEARLMDEKRRREQQEREIAEKERAHQDRLRQQELQKQHELEERTPQKPKGQQMPGGFIDSPATPTPPTTTGGGGGGGGWFNRFTKNLGLDLPSPTPTPSPPPPPPPQNQTPRNEQKSVTRPPIIKKPTNHPTSPAQISSNIASAIASSRPHNSSILFSPPTTREVTESHTFCDTTPGQNILFLAEVAGIPVYVERTMPEEERSEWLKQKMSALRAFAGLMGKLVSVFNIPAKAMHIFYDTDGNTIAFNLNGALFCNFRFYETLHHSAVTPNILGALAAKGDAAGSLALGGGKETANGMSPLVGTSLALRGSADSGGSGREWKEAVKYWYVTVCHELAHNIHKEHGSEHGFYTESIVVEFWERVEGIMAGTN